MEQEKRSSLSLTTVLLVLLFAAVIVMGCITFKAAEDKNQIKEAVTDLCRSSMKDIELNLRQGDNLSPEYFYRFHQITQIYPETYYADLSETLLVLTDSSLSASLSQEERELLADQIVITYDEELSEKKWEQVLYDIENILSPHIYP